MLEDKTFKTIIDSTPLVSIDILLKKNDKVLLGRRINKPAQGLFFSIGGRVLKNETINNAILRIVQNELNLELKYTPEFIGVFEHFYFDSIYENVSTHYVNIAYKYEIEEALNPPTAQHSEYKWFSVSELLISEQVHIYTKDYFRT